MFTKSIRKRLINRLGLKDQSGAISTLMVILFSSGLVLGLVAAVIDIGQVKYQRVRIQTAATAVGQALAKNCSAKNVTCSSTLTPDSTLQQIANSASPNNPNYITEICGSADAHVFNPAISPTCQALNPLNPYECKPIDSVTYPQYARWVRVHVSNVSNGGDNSALFPFMRSVISPGSISTIETKACAQWAYGMAGTITTNPAELPYPVLNLALTMCDVAGNTEIRSVNDGGVIDTSSQSCSFTDYRGATYSNYSVRSWYRWKTGGTCPGGAQLELNDMLCINNAWSELKALIGVGVSFRNQFSSGATQNRVYSVPIIGAVPTLSGTNYVAPVKSFVNVRLKGLRLPPTTTGGSVQYFPNNQTVKTEMDKSWCTTSNGVGGGSGSEKYCIWLAVDRGISTARGAAKNITGPNMGLEALTPLP